MASPDWQDQIIYFLMIDRFNDGDSALNDQGQNEFDPTSDKKFSGGDLVGVSDKLSYIEDLGAHRSGLLRQLLTNGGMLSKTTAATMGTGRAIFKKWMNTLVTWKATKR
ncbi:hypothetical protein HC02_23580 [Vibrio parahaemolyticus]|nr:hypothetical protein HC02_23580 [Vibrio parahaemolyticus]